MFVLTRVPEDVDLAAFSRWLRAQGVVHRVTEEGAEQVLWLAEDEWRQPVLTALHQYLSSPEWRARVATADEPEPEARRSWQPGPAQAPVMLGLVALAAIITWAIGFGTRGPLHALFMVDTRHWDPVALMSTADRWHALMTTLASGQIWRLITPVFLHFSVSHLAFDAVMFWFLGSQIEARDGKVIAIVLFLVSGILSNFSQYILTGPEFGGLSGVVYAMLGYCWLSQQRLPRFYFPPALIVVSVVWMLLGLTPIPEALNIGKMANGAHAAGFISGLAFALLVPPPRERRDA